MTVTTTDANTVTIWMETASGFTDLPRDSAGRRSFRIVAMDELLSEAEMSEYLKISVGTLRRRHTEGTGPPPLRVCRGVLYRRSEVDAWLERQSKDRDE